MKKSVKKTILIVLGCVLLVPVVAIGALVATRETPDGPRVRASADVIGVEAGGAYAWIVRTRSGAVLVDAGMDSTGTAILAELESQGVDPAQVRAVLITHGHPDHYAAAARFQNAAVMVGADDVEMVKGDKSRYSTFGRIVGAVLPLPPVPPRLTPVHGGERLEYDGATLTVVTTPGHSPGSVMYLYKDVLFTGDSLMRKGDGVAIAPSMFSYDAGRNRDSIRALEPLSFSVIADGHAGVTQAAKGKVARFLAGDR